jgi:hypothetical protein
MMVEIAVATTDEVFQLSVRAQDEVNRVQCL